ncbi:MAG: phosphoribosylanthranilate isomerase [Geminicoccaceae bacterium]
MVRVKVCGHKRPDDARMSCAYGADAVGVLVGQTHVSADFVPLDAARAIFAAVPPFIARVLVTHVMEASDIVALVTTAGADHVQLHGACTPATVRALRAALPRVRLIKTVHVQDARSVDIVRSWPSLVDAVLLDSASPATGQIGGTGRPHDWRLSARIVQDTSLPVILAGGLHGGNVGQAIACVRPFAVDANSGTKQADGYKDPARLAAFIQAAKAA